MRFEPVEGDADQGLEFHSTRWGIGTVRGSPLDILNKVINWTFDFPRPEKHLDADRANSTDFLIFTPALPLRGGRRKYPLDLRPTKVKIMPVGSIKHLLVVAILYPQLRVSFFTKKNRRFIGGD